MSKTIDMTCTECGKKFSLGLDHRGSLRVCSDCGGEMITPLENMVLTMTKTMKAVSTTLPSLIDEVRSLADIVNTLEVRVSKLEEDS